MFVVENLARVAHLDRRRRELAGRFKIRLVDIAERGYGHVGLFEKRA